MAKPTQLPNLIQQRAAFAQQQRDVARDRALPTVAETLGHDAVEYPWMKADVLTALSLTGAPGQVKDAIAQSAAQQAFKAGAFVTPTKKPKKGGWSIGKIFRTGVKYTTAALSAPQEAANNVIGAGLNFANKYGIAAPTGGGVAGALITSGASAGQIARDAGAAVKGASQAFKATTLAQMIDHRSESGTGYFASKAIMDRQSEAARQARGVDSSGQAWTLGRYAGQQALNGGLVKSSNEAAYNLLSGAIDFGAAIALDPLNIARGATAPVEAGQAMSAASRGSGFIGDSIYAGRQAKAAAVTARTSEALTQARRATQLAAETEEGVRGVARIASRPGAVMLGPAVQRQAANAATELEKAASFRKYAQDLVDYAENINGITSKFDELAKTAPERAALIRKSAGLIDNPKTGKAVFQPVALKQLLGNEGRRTVEFLSEETSPTRIMALWKGKIPTATAVALADAKNPEEVIGALGRALSIEGGARDVANVGRWANIKVNAAQSRRFFGQSASARDATLHWDDPERAAQSAFNLLGNAKVVGEERNAIVDRLMRSMADGNKGAFHYAALGSRDEKLLAREIEDTVKLLDETVDPDIISQLDTKLGNLQQGQELVGAVGDLHSAMASKLKGGFYQRTVGGITERLSDYAERTGSDVAAAFSKKLDQGIIHDADIEKFFKRPKGEYGQMSLYSGMDMRTLDPQFSNGPLRYTQLFNDSVEIMDPAAIERVRVAASGYSKLLLNTFDGRSRRLPVAVAEHLQMEVWRGLVILRPALGVRMLAEEALRTAFGGGFRGTGDMIQAAIRTGDNVDAFGLAHDAASKIAKLEKKISTLEAVAGKADEVAKLRTEVDALEAAFARGKVAMADAMGGKRSRGYLASIERKFGGKEDDIVALGHWDTINKGDSRFQRRYQKALIDELNSMAADPVYKRLANGGLLPGDHIGTKVWTAADNSTFDDIVDWAQHGAGQSYWSDFAANKGWDVADRSKIVDWLNIQKADLDHHFLNNPEAKSAIMSGYLRGSKLVEPSKYGRTPHTKEMEKWAKEFAESADSPDVVRYELTLRQMARSDKPEQKLAYERYRSGMSRAFQAIYSNKSDRLYRVPLFNERYWESMEGMLPKLTREDALLAASNAEKAGLDADQLARIKTIASTANGVSTLDAADDLARGWAVDDIKKLFFKADSDPYAVDRAKLVFPFIRAFAEVGTTWGRLLSQDPTILHSVDKGIRGLRGGDSDPDTGVFHTDANGDEVFTYPGTGNLTELITGVNAPFTGKAGSLNIVGSVLPGVGPIVSVPGYFIAQHSPLPQSMISMLFPYGEPPSPTDLTTYLPGYASKLLKGWNQDEQDQIYGNTYFRTVQYLMSTDEYGRNPEDQARLLEDAKGKASALTALRGLIQAFGPAAPVPTYMANTPGGDVIAAKMMKDYGDMIANPQRVEDAGFDDATAMFLDKYGEKNVGYLVGRTSSEKTGAASTDQFVEWRNGDGAYAAKTYPEVYGYIGPQAGNDDFSLNAFSQLVKSGDRKSRSANDLIATANTVMANNIWYETKDKIAALYPNPSKDQQAAIDARLKEIRTGLQTDFPGWSVEGTVDVARGNNKRKAAHLQQMAADERLADNSTVQSLRQYYQAKATAEAAAKNLGVTLASQKAAGIRDWLEQGALSLAGADDGFAEAWSKVLSKDLPKARTTGSK